MFLNGPCFHSIDSPKSQSIFIWYFSMDVVIMDKILQVRGFYGIAWIMHFDIAPLCGLRRRFRWLKNTSKDVLSHNIICMRLSSYDLTSCDVFLSSRSLRLTRWSYEVGMNVLHSFPLIWYWSKLFKLIKSFPLTGGSAPKVHGVVCDFEGVLRLIHNDYLDSRF